MNGRRAGVPHATPLVDVRLSVDRDIPTQARRAAGAVLGDIEPNTRYNFLLIVSELVANAVLHSRSPKWLRVLRRGSVLRAEVHDGSREPPLVLAPSPYRAHGRGMFLVDSFADDWGVETNPAGKIVWAEVNAPLRGDREG
ncbi:ATP-binding protein [Saccharomonospora xinjiangensis]|uniref:Histidine kinase/HSP90-like ATPase domain-containing protein n=1 Tax=Saccharomonospora xinjiangensis XJ-54 TaxID=882086 RepID=I0V4V0_9PSEU|nr:ATP-binding protein [Saccharomonospora xinjiangensis]EID55153.1 hypothetical protein SacxiDRAFT_2941 [Saccharomonospora xinjiangensis XJ-54]QBQ61894.1 hypothetical protein EYD13_17750 [Saccharomonospora xinjiangensis]